MTSMQVHKADMASTQSQILERLERLEMTSAMWEQEHVYNWTAEQGSAEFDLEEALGGIIEAGQRVTRQRNAGKRFFCCYVRYSE